MEWYCFLFTYLCGLVCGAFICMRVPSMAPTIPGNPFRLLNSCSSSCIVCRSGQAIIFSLSLNIAAIILSRHTTAVDSEIPKRSAIFLMVSIPPTYHKVTRSCLPYGVSSSWTRGLQFWEFFNMVQECTICGSIHPEHPSKIIICIIVYDLFNVSPNACLFISFPEIK